MDADAVLLRAWALEGGTSAEATALEIGKSDGTIEKLVVRRHGPRDLAANSHVAAEEFRLLQVLKSHGLVVPTPRHVDERGTVLASPFVVVDFIEGTHEIAPGELPAVIRHMADFLAALHRVDADDPTLAFLSRQDIYVAELLSAPPDHLDEALSEGRVRAALAALCPPPRHNGTAVLHGDFWPGNILWRDGRLAAVIDWEDAASGDPLADLAVARLDLLWTFGPEAMDDFTAAYLGLAAIDSTAVPWWDLWAALRPAGKLDGWGLEPAEQSAMVDQHRWFVARAIDELAAAG
jgi:aminoglycoside phosphotransferase (APT) family kinase protein